MMNCMEARLNHINECRNEGQHLCQGAPLPSPSVCLPAPAAENVPSVMSFLVQQLGKNCHPGIYNH